MKEIRAIECRYEIIYKVEDYTIYPFFQSFEGDKIMHELTPLHGRSFIVGQMESGKTIVIKGSGLAYTRFSYLHTGEYGNHALGILLKEDAARDFTIGREIESYGIKTNHMHSVIELDFPISFPKSDVIIRPILLQYEVECPYRIEDAPFMSKERIKFEVSKWQKKNSNKRALTHLIAADVLLHNLRILHEHGVLHNALTTHNITWALELLDFEIAYSPNFPYPNGDDQSNVRNLFAREVVDVYKIIIYIAEVLSETVDYAYLDSMFADYGFDLSQYTVIQK